MRPSRSSSRMSRMSTKTTLGSSFILSASSTLAVTTSALASANSSLTVFLSLSGIDFPRRENIVLYPRNCPAVRARADLTKSELGYQRWPFGKQPFQVALRPHLNLERAIAGIVFLDSCDSITREASCRRDYENINFGRLPSSNLLFEGGYIGRRNTLSHPMPTLN